MRCILEDGNSSFFLLYSPFIGDCSTKREDRHGEKGKTPTTEGSFHISKRNFFPNTIWIILKKGKEKKRRRWSFSSNQNLSKVIKCTSSAEQWSPIKFLIFFKFYQKHFTTVMSVFISRVGKGNRTEGRTTSWKVFNMNLPKKIIIKNFRILVFHLVICLLIMLFILY